MCIIDVKAGMRHSTVSQAMAHNVSTLDRDLDFYRSWLSTHEHSDTEMLELCNNAQMHLHAAYTALLSCWEHVMAGPERDIADPLHPASEETQAEHRHRIESAEHYYGHTRVISREPAFYEPLPEVK